MSTICFAWAAVAAKGFSHRTCFPALAACAASIRCELCGVAMYTAAISGFARHSANSPDPEAAVAPNFLAINLAFFASRPTTEINFERLHLAKAGNTELLAILPRPTTAYPIFSLAGMRACSVLSSRDPRGPTSDCEWPCDPRRATLRYFRALC